MKTLIIVAFLVVASMAAIIPKSEDVNVDSQPDQCGGGCNGYCAGDCICVGDPHGAPFGQCWGLDQLQSSNKSEGIIRIIDKV